MLATIRERITWYRSGIRFRYCRVNEKYEAYNRRLRYVFGLGKTRKEAVEDLKDVLIRINHILGFAGRKFGGSHPGQADFSRRVASWEARKPPEDLGKPRRLTGLWF